MFSEYGGEMLRPYYYEIYLFKRHFQQEYDFYYQVSLFILLCPWKHFLLLKDMAFGDYFYFYPYASILMNPLFSILNQNISLTTVFRS